MGMQSQISEKIRAMSEPNRKIEEETREAEQRAAEGYKSEPQVEQVKPGPRKDKRKNAKTVSVKQEREDKAAPTGEMKSAAEDAEAKEATLEELPNNTEARKEKSSNLNKSLQDFEDLLSETSEPREEKVPKKDTVYIEPKHPEDEPGEKESEAEKPKDIKTTVRHSPRNKGYHAVYRHAVKNIDALTEDTSEKEPVYCLYEPLTGSLNELVRDVTVIGKSTETNIRINNRFVSGIHARVIKESDGCYYIEDIGTTGTGSTNGTKVNGVRIAPGREGRTKLEPGDIIILANTQIIFDVKK